MGSRARQQAGRQREVPPRFAKLNQNRLAPKSNTNGTSDNSSAQYNNHQARNPRNKKTYCQSEPERERSAISAATRKQIENTRTILSKLNFDNSEELALELDQLQLRDDWYVVTEVAKLIYEKSVDADCVELTRSCAKLVHQFVSHQQSVQWALAKNLRKQLLDSCQQEFQKTRSNPAARVEWGKTSGQEFEEGREAKRKIGNARLLGEFYKLQWLTPRIMVEMVQTLLGRKDQTGRNCQESLYQLFELLISVGEELENQLEEMSWRHQKEGGSQRFVPEPNWVDKICGQIKELEDDQRLGDDTRLAMAILLKLRRNKWNWDSMNLDGRTSSEAPSRMTTAELAEPSQVQSELGQQENGTFNEDFNVATSNRYQFLVSPPPLSADPTDVYLGEQPSHYYGPTFFVPVALANAVAVPHSPLLDQGLILVPNGTCSQEQDEDVQSHLEITDTQTAASILYHYLVNSNFENAEDLILSELHEPDGFEKLISSVVELVVSATSKGPERRGAAELIKALVESDRNPWTFKDIVASVQQGVMQDISVIVEERPKAAMHLTAFLAQVFSDQPRFSWVAQLASGLEDAETFSRSKSLEVLRNVMTVLSSMLRL